MLNRLLMLVAGIMLISCSSVSVLRNPGVSSDDLERDPETIRVYSTADAGQEYIVLGSIVVASDAGENANRPMKILKEEAAFLGADAVVNLRLEFEYGNWDVAIKATATAVKFVTTTK